MAYELQRNFSAGELTPKMQLRNDAGDLYFNSVSLLRNMLPEPWGPASSRKGFEFIEEIPLASGGRLFSFQVNFAESFVVVVNKDDVFVADKLGFTLSDNIVLNPAFGDGNLHWLDRNNVQYVGGSALLKPTVGNLASIRQQLGVQTGVTYRFKIQTFSIEPVLVKLGLVDGGSTVLEQHFDGPQIQFDILLNTNNLWMEIIAEPGQPNIAIDVVTCQAENAIDDDVRFDSPWTEFEVVALQVDMVPDNKIMYFVTQGHDVWKLTRNDDGEWIFSIVNFTFGVSGDLWPNDGPGAITFHDRRMWLGGSNEHPITLWGSKPGEFEDFDTGNPEEQTPGDAMVLPLDKHGEIQWLLSNKGLFAGLDTGEHVIFGVQGPLDVDNAQTEQHSSYGSQRIQAMTVNETTVYVDTQGRDVRAMDFDDRNESFASIQISFQAEHITEGFIIDAAYGSAPAGIIWFVTADGDLLSCSIEKDQGTIGWARHHTQGDVIAVTTLKESGRDVPWILVRRPNAKIYLERYAYEFPLYLDSGLFFADDNPQTEWPYFQHLAGLTVQVLADRAVHPDVLITPEGVLVTQYPVSNVIGGLGYKCTMRTLPKIAQRETGNTFAHFKSWASIVISVLESSRPIVNGEDLAVRHPVTPMDTGEPMETEYLETTDLGYDFQGYVTIEQDVPLPLTILGIGGKLIEDAL